MKVKLKGTSGAPFEVTEVHPETYNGEPTIPFVQYFCDEEGTIYKDELLEFVTDDQLQTTATIEGWVAVDDFDNAYIYHSKPTQRCKEFCDTGDYVTDWVCNTKYPNGKRCYVIDKDLFPDLTPESEPLKVRIQITPE